MTSKTIDLKSPHLGSELLKDPKGDLPVRVWCEYVSEHTSRTDSTLVFTTYEHLFNSDAVPIDPQQAVDDASVLLLDEVIVRLMWGSRKDAYEAAKRALDILYRGSSWCRRGRGQPPTMRPYAARAYTIRKFNPDPAKPGESTVKWAKLADMLFVDDGKCPRCDVARHQYNSACVKALQTAVGRLTVDMKSEGIPL